MKALYPTALLLLILLWRPGTSTLGAIWADRWALLFAGALLPYFWGFPWKHRIYPLLLSYLFLLACAMGCGIWGFPSRELVPSLEGGALGTVVALLVFSATLRVGWGKILPYLGVVQAIGILACPWHPLQVPFLNNPSMAATFVALTLVGLPWSLRLLSIVAVLWAGRHMPIAVLGIELLVLWGRAWVCIPALAVFILLFPHADNGRFAMWRLLAQLFAEQPTPTQLFGMGAGSTVVWLPGLQMVHLDKDATQLPLWIWAHNDWLQLVFEFGVVGGLLVLWAGVQLLLDCSRKNLAVLLGFAVAMLGNMPLHWSLTALVLWAVIGEEALADIQTDKRAGLNGPHPRVV